MNTPTNSEALPLTTGSPSSGTPRCDLLERTTLNPVDWMALARTLENEVEFYKSALLHAPVVDAKELRKRLYELPELVLANEKKNPAWGKAELWGIERDIIPSVRMLCWSVAALLPENAELRERSGSGTPAHSEPTEKMETSETKPLRAVPLQRLVRPLWMMGGEVNDWAEDASHENGQYFNRCPSCDEDFIGHKGRHICRKCHHEAKARYDAMSPDERAAHDALIASEYAEFCWTNTQGEVRRDDTPLQQ